MVTGASASSDRLRGGLRILFLGTPAFAVPTLQHLLDSRHTVCGVLTQPDRPRGRGQRVSDAPVKSLALAHHLPLLQPERLRDPALLETIAAWAPDLGVVAAYGRLIPDPLLALPRLGMINVHASLLPRYRGAAPIHRAVMDGEQGTGVTIMRVVTALDAGAMFAVSHRPIDPNETSDAVERDLAEIGATLLVRVVDAIDAGTAREEPQDDRLSTYAPKITRADAAIDWTRPAVQIHNQVRGLYPWPHAHAFLDGRRVIVLTTRVAPESPRATADTPAGTTSEHDTRIAGARGESGAVPNPSLPGTIVAVSGDAIRVVTGQGDLDIVSVQPEGRRPMPVRDFLAGHPISPGSRFSAGV